MFSNSSLDTNFRIYFQSVSLISSAVVNKGKNGEEGSTEIEYLKNKEAFLLK